MPRPRRTRPRRVRPRKARRQRRNRKNAIVHLPGTLAPQHMLTQLKYVQQYQKNTPLLGAYGMYNQFRLNSIYDPDYTNTLGTSCLGLIQWRGLYQRYRVYKVAYTIRISNISSDTMVSGAVVFQNYLDSSFSVSDLMRPLSRRFQLGNKEGSNKATIKGVVNLPKLAGVTPQQYKADNNNIAGFGSSPVNPLYMTVICSASNGAVNASVAAQCDLTYFVEMMSTETSEALDLNTGLPVVPGTAVCTVPGGIS